MFSLVEYRLTKLNKSEAGSQRPSSDRRRGPKKKKIARIAKLCRARTLKKPGRLTTGRIAQCDCGKHVWRPRLWQRASRALESATLKPQISRSRCAGQLGIRPMRWS